MAYLPKTQLTSTSFSRYSQYTRCPLSSKLQHLDRIVQPPEPDGPMARGNAIHKLAETYLSDAAVGAPKLPAELKQFEKFFKAVRAQRKKAPDTVAMEQTWAFRRDWTVTRFDDWNGCWLRVKTDLTVITPKTGVVEITDWKTGKFSPQWNLDEYLLQLDLYAVGALVIRGSLPGVKVIPRLRFLDHGIVYPLDGEEKVYTLADLPRLKKEWEDRFAPMLADKQFAPRPNKLCGYCFYRKDNKAAGGGQCPM